MAANPRHRFCAPNPPVLHQVWLKRVLGILLAFTSALALGLPEDRHQTIEILSQEAVRNEPKGLTVYQGDVVIKQGTILIRANRVSVYSNGKKVDRIVCEGAPAHFQQQPEADSDLVIARGNTIEYNLNRDLIVLAKNASLVQEDATLSGDLIEYDLKQDIIRAKGGKDDERIRMVIPPSQQQESN